MKKFFSFFLAIIMIISLSVSVYANPCSISDAVVRIQHEVPNAEIHVENSTIHVVVNDITIIPWLNDTFRTNQSRTTTVYSSNGGSFRDFIIPWYGNFYFTPYSQVYMNKDVVESLKLRLHEPSIFNAIVSSIASGMTSDAIAAMVYATWNIVITPGMVSFIAGIISYYATDLEYLSLKSAQDSSVSGKVYVVRGMTPDGISTYIYAPWNDNTCVTYNDYDATWYGGVFDI